MCGFAGELARDRAANVAAVERMAARLARRGPDGQGSWSSGPIALADVTKPLAGDHANARRLAEGRAGCFHGSVDLAAVQALSLTHI